MLQKANFSLLGSQTQMSVQNENTLHNSSPVCHALFAKQFQLSSLHHSVVSSDQQYDSQGCEMCLDFGLRFSDFSNAVFNSP